jgi:hypothetical protein
MMLIPGERVLFEKHGKKWKEREYYPKDAKRLDFEIGDRRDEV